jgi:cell division GTPase FtsZ
MTISDTRLYSDAFNTPVLMFGKTVDVIKENDGYALVTYSLETTGLTIHTRYSTKFCDGLDDYINSHSILIIELGNDAQEVIFQKAKEAGAFIIGFYSGPREDIQYKNGKFTDKRFKELDSIIVTVGEIKTVKNKSPIFAGKVFGQIAILVSKLLEEFSEARTYAADPVTQFLRRGVTFTTMAEYSGENAASHSLYDAVKSVSIDNASGAMVLFNMHPDYPFHELSKAMEIINLSVNENSEVFFGSNKDESLPKDYVNAMVLTVGYDSCDAFNDGLS